jgi:predicted ATPase
LDNQARARTGRLLEEPHRFAVPEIHQEMETVARDDEHARRTDVIAEVTDIRCAGHDERIESQRTEALTNARVARG